MTDTLKGNSVAIITFLVGMLFGLGGTSSIAFIQYERVTTRLGKVEQRLSRIEGQLENARQWQQRQNRGNMD